MSSSPVESPPSECVQITISGAVQGVGFRPFVYRLAHALAIRGWVNNTPQGVTIHAEAPPDRLAQFIESVRADAPPHASIAAVQVAPLPCVGYADFTIHASVDDGRRSAYILPDLATCPACLAELFDPHNRRYRYPFINCTHCGPRYSIIEALPYDRPHTTMRGFTMCPACQREYDDPLDRRFHAQPTACPACGPTLALWGMDGGVRAAGDAALIEAEAAIRAGLIVGLKGLGGFQLLVDARDAAAVARLRRRKLRPAKPFAIMYPYLDAVRRDCDVTNAEADLLISAAAPIVLLKRRAGAQVAPEVAPDNPYLGVMLPYTPLHHLLLGDLGFPVVATSGNRSGEPICIDAGEALDRLDGITDLLLVHDRPIARPVDDSVVRVMAGRSAVLRLARGYAPLSLPLVAAEGRAVGLIAPGGQQKNAIALYDGASITLGHHIGDLDAPETVAAFRRAAADLPALYAIDPAGVACDLHPDYYTTRWAEATHLPLTRVQHHMAHVLACMAEHQLEGPALGVAWDGTGYGPDQTIWGGEFLRIDAAECRRVAHLMCFPLPGGERAIREPRRAALGLLYRLFGPDLPPDVIPITSFTDAELSLIGAALAKGVHAPVSSGAGRLFDAVAALLGIMQVIDFEGQAAMALEFAALDSALDPAAYPFWLPDAGLEIDLKPMIGALLDDWRAGAPIGQIALAFHHTLAEIIGAQAERAGLEDVILSGGCFQNKLLLELAVERLRRAGHAPYWHQRIPPNDGGIAVGQIVAEVRGYTGCV